ncbi:hypothetical protein SBRCBS47491_002495 [Sporothrix bragantina]|uniref:Major facilitator superfamily (MFS) profile domain-containing protein n=1 Tax=Sporothrix bragantina TaxID=671064 RepID=A0ABP0B7A9_9PEZI
MDSKSVPEDVPQPALHVEVAEAEEDGGDHTLKQTASAVIAGDTAFAAFTRVEAIRYFWWPVLLSMVATLACMNDGFQNQLPGSLISNQGFINQFGTEMLDDGGKALSASWVSTWGAMMPVGQVPGSLFAGWINDKVGRRGGMYAMTVAYIVGTILEMTAKEPGQWAGAKFMFGLGQGLTATTMPVYVSEIAPPQLRGTLLCMYGFFFAIGQLVASVILYVIQNTRPLDWRLAVYTEWSFHGLWIVFGLLWLPESPWHYARKKNDEAALKSLNRIYKYVGDFDPYRELRVMKNELNVQAHHAMSPDASSSIMDLFRGTDRLRTFGSALAVSTQMLSGCIVIFTYTTYFVQQAGIGEPFLASMIVTIVLLVGLVVSFFAVEFLGRRTLLIGGGIGCTICNLVIGITGCFPKTPALNHAALAFVFLFVFSYAVSFAGVCWAMVSEVSSSRLKSKSAAFATLTYDLVLLAFTVSVPYMLASTGPGARDWGTKSLFCFAITAGLATLGNYFLCPETKGRTQGEMDEIYEKRIPPRKSAKYVTSLEIAGGKTHHD